MLRNFGMIVSALAIGMAMTTGALASTTVTIIQDTYTETSGTSLVTHSPNINTNLPGGTYQIGNSDLGIGGTVGDPATTTVTDVARVGNNSAFVLTLASNFPYAKPTTFTVSADLNLEAMPAASSLPSSGDINTVNQSGIVGGIVLGFYSSSSLTNYQGPLGVAYSDTGNLLLVEPSGTQDKVVAVVSVSSLGIPSYSDTNTYTLAYTVDTDPLAETISNVTFGGVAVNFGTIPTGLFTDANTYYVGAYARSGNADFYGTLDNLTVTTQVPEPASMSLLVLGGMAALGLRRRRAVK